MFLSMLINLRVLIVDSTGISTLPANLAALEKLHTLSIRRNKMHSLPSWLCVLPELETLLVDGNPFQGPWKALMEPLLSRGPLSPTYPPSTPMFPLPSASIRSTMTSTSMDAEDALESVHATDRHTREEEDVTVTSPRAPSLARAITAPSPQSSMHLSSPGLSRTRTTPNRTYFDKNRTSSAGPKSMFSEAGPSSATSRDTPDSERELRKMKSAGELRRNYGGSIRAPSASASSSPQRPALTEYVTSASSSNLLNMSAFPADSQGGVPRRFASLGVASGALSPTASSRSRRTVDSTIWDSPTEEVTGAEPVPPLPTPNQLVFPRDSPVPMDHALPPRPRSSDKDKGSRWGFLKKMSMGKIRPESPNPSRISINGGSQARHPFPAHHPQPRQLSSIPAIDVRISTTGTILQDQKDQLEMPPGLSRKASADLLKISPLDQLKKTSNEAAKLAPTATSPNSLLVPSPTPSSRASKRRSFLPIDMTPIPIPNASQFCPDLTVTDGSEEPGEEHIVPSPVQVETLDEIQRREEEHAREARIRALRSVKAYLRDMHDLNQSLTQTMSMYGGPPPEIPQTRSRRPTMVDGGPGRMPSDMSVSSMSSGSPSSRPESVNLRSTEGRSRGNATQTNSVATTDSGGSGAGEERKCKDDKAKRARVIREIVEWVSLFMLRTGMNSPLESQDGADVRQGSPRTRRHLHQARVCDRQRS